MDKTEVMYQNKAAWLALLPTAMENASCKVDKLLCDVWFPPEVVLNPQVSTEEIKSREVVLGLRVGLLLLKLFPNSGAMDIAFVTVQHSGWDSNCVIW